MQINSKQRMEGGVACACVIDVDGISPMTATAAMQLCMNIYMAQNTNKHHSLW